ncbi:uncharacterized protein si:dkey-261l7.2 isoform X2 [Heterodontus francisci]|uniref:uncharacterized protein si:dkey-261l7.2 isoform X2 n=1 Tax=Heterodontus francisci TaxID=7792 RepID=UPI00355C8F19
MPQLTAAAALQIGLLLSALPAQYILSRWSGSDSTQRIQASRRSIQNEDPLGESPAVEVFLLKEKDGYFADSPEPRSPRPPYVKYRVGQVFRHEQDGYLGVIVGWDEKARAPEDWLNQRYPSNMQDLKNTPHYKVLIHTTDGSNSGTIYIPEKDMVIVTGVQMLSNLLSISSTFCFYYRKTRTGSAIGCPQQVLAIEEHRSGNDRPTALGHVVSSAPRWVHPIVALQRPTWVELENGNELNSLIFLKEVTLSALLTNHWKISHNIARSKSG